MSAARDPLIQHFHRSSTTGLVLVDRRGKPVYFNSDAIRVLTYPRRFEEATSLLNLLPQEIQRTLANGKASDGSSQETEFRSGNRRYLCRAFTLTHNSKDPSKVTTALVIERAASKPAEVAEIAKRFHLTEREQQTVGLLSDGLTSKEIACRMNISTNTVKTFLHLIMAKMSVPTRSAIIGKLWRS